MHWIKRWKKPEQLAFFFWKKACMFRPYFANTHTQVKYLCFDLCQDYLYSIPLSSYGVNVLCLAWPFEFYFFFTPAIDDDGDHQLESTTTTPPPPPRLNVSFVEWWWCFFWVEFFFTRKKTWLEMKIWFFSGNTRILLIHSIPNFLFSFFSIANSCVCLCVCVCVAGYIQFKTNK